MKIMGIDSSTKITGVAIIDSETGELIDHFIIDYHTYREAEYRKRTKDLS